MRSAAIWRPGLIVDGQVPTPGWVSLMKGEWLLDFNSKTLSWTGMPRTGHMTDLEELRLHIQAACLAMVPQDMLHSVLRITHDFPMEQLCSGCCLLQQDWGITEESMFHLKGASLKGGRDAVEWSRVFTIGDLDDEALVSINLFCNDEPHTEEERNGVAMRPDEKLPRWWPNGHIDVLIPTRRYVQLEATRGSAERGMFFVRTNGNTGSYAMAVPLSRVPRYGHDYYSGIPKIDPVFLTTCIA